MAPAAAVAAADVAAAAAREPCFDGVTHTNHFILFSAAPTV